MAGRGARYSHSLPALGLSASSLIASSKWSEYAESSGLFDEVIAVDPQRFVGERIYRRVTCYQIAKRRFVMAINPTYSRGTWTDDFLVKATGASTSIGQVGDLSNASIRMKRITDRWYTQLVPIPEHAAHELVKNFTSRNDLIHMSSFAIQSWSPL